MREVGEAADALVFHERGQLGVLLAVRERVEPQHRRLQRRAELAEANWIAQGAHAAAHRDRVGQGSEALESGCVCVRARVRQPHVVRVRIEHHHAQAGLHQSRSRSTPSEYVLPEPDWPHRNVWRPNPPHPARWHAVRRQLADLEHGARGADRPSHSSTSSGRRAHGRVVERPLIAIQHDSSPRPADAHLRQAGAGGVVALELQRQHLPEPSTRRRASRSRRPRARARRASSGS